MRGARNHHTGVRPTAHAEPVRVRRLASRGGSTRRRPCRGPGGTDRRAEEPVAHAVRVAAYGDLVLVPVPTRQHHGQTADGIPP
ncbi:hypothetical protein, partial [Streptomyces sp. NPDC002530]